VRVVVEPVSELAPLWCSYAVSLTILAVT